MYHYAVSVYDKLVAEADFRRSLIDSRMRRIEYSCAGDVPPDLVAARREALMTLRDEGWSRSRASTSPSCPSSSGLTLRRSRRCAAPR